MNEIRDDLGLHADMKLSFPILNHISGQHRLVYLDSAASTQKPACVIDAVSQYYQQDNANVHRGLYELSERATERFERARHRVQYFLSAQHNHEIIFTRGATEAINLVASSFADFVAAGDEVLVTELEHHSNIVPWQMLCQRVGATLRVVPILQDGTLDMSAYEQLLTSKTRMVAVTHISNALGTVNPVKQMVAMAHAKDIPVLIDGAQAVAHTPVDVSDLDCDFYVFSGHKLYAPMGIGVLYAKEKWLEKMPPYQTGGDMIRTVSFDKTDFNVLPYKFEAGTPNVAGAIGLEEAINYIERLGMSKIVKHEADLMAYALDRLASVPHVRVIGDMPERSGAISITMDNAHPHDIATIMDKQGIAARAGHHCAMPLMKVLGVPATLRISFGVHNTREDIDVFVAGLEQVNSIFR